MEDGSASRAYLDAVTDVEDMSQTDECGNKKTDVDAALTRQVG